LLCLCFVLSLLCFFCSLWFPVVGSVLASLFCFVPMCDISISLPSCCSLTPFLPTFALQPSLSLLSLSTAPCLEASATASCPRWRCSRVLTTWPHSQAHHRRRRRRVRSPLPRWAPCSASRRPRDLRRRWQRLKFDSQYPFGVVVVVVGGGGVFFVSLSFTCSLFTYARKNLIVMYE